MKIVTAEEMQRIDKLANCEGGIPGIVLMDQAAKAVAEVAINEDNSWCNGSKKFVVFCGKGNNGGDGFGAARYLLNYGAQVSIFIVGAKVEDLQGDAACEAEMLLKAGFSINSIYTAEELSFAEIKALRAGVIIDALLGTGFKGELKSLYKDVCRMINSLGKRVVSVDVPTGVDADFGICAEDAINASITVTMALPKTGLLLYPGKEKAGKLILADIGIPQNLLDNFDSKKYFLEHKDIAAMVMPRKPNAHKGDAGRVIIAAGSPGFTGAAAMSAWGAIKAGAGLVSLLTPLSCREVLSSKLTEVMVHGLLERMPGVLGSAAEGDVLQRLNLADVLAIGPGLGTTENTIQVVLNILQKANKPVVIDADAITALKGNMEILPKMKVPKVLTPHPGEMARITGVDIKVIDRERINVAAHYAKEWKATVVLKGAPTVVALEDGSVFVNSTGCSAMATGGSGDVLTGVIAAFIASGMEPSKAAIAAVYLHGLAGEIASDNEVGLAAGDIANALPKARKALCKTEDLEFAIYNTSLKMVK